VIAETLGAGNKWRSLFATYSPKEYPMSRFTSLAIGFAALCVTASYGASAHVPSTATLTDEGTIHTNLQLTDEGTIHTNSQLTDEGTIHTNLRLTDEGTIHTNLRLTDEGTIHTN
jgi:UDP-3-O-[3-hydroxymyristoyl] glucosamine N-acyltransferase